MLLKTLRRLRRKNRIRSKISGTGSKPRLAIFRSNTNIYAQLIDDVSCKTLTAASDQKMKKAWTKTQMAMKVGEEIGKKIADLKIEEIVFDKGWFAYHGRVKALADSVRASWIKF